MSDIIIGSFTASVVLNVLLRLIYNTINIPDKLKPWIAIVLGMGFGVVAMFYADIECGFRCTVDHLTLGFMTGANAVGLYEITRRHA